MRKIVEDIIARLKAEVPELRYIAQDWGQITYYSQTSAPVKYPCALVNVENGSFEQIGENVQEGLLQVVVNIADIFTQVSGNAPEGLRDRELQLYDTAMHVYQALQGWTGGNNYSALIRTMYGRTIRKDGINIQTLTFTLNWQDESARRTPQSAKDTGVLVQGVKLKLNRN